MMDRLPFIGIIQTTLIASKILALTHFGAKLVGATGHNVCKHEKISPKDLFSYSAIVDIFLLLVVKNYIIQLSVF